MIKKIAFCFIIIDNLNHYDIWKNFLEGKEQFYNIYFHVKNKKNINQNIVFNNIIPEQAGTNWGDVEHAKKLLFTYAKKDNNFKYIVLSESCLPIKSFDYIYDYITKDNFTYIKFQSHLVNMTKNNERGSLIKNIEKYLYLCKNNVNFSSIIDISHWHYNEAWYILNNDHIEFFLDDDKYINYFKGRLNSDESYPSYILSFKNNQGLNNKNIKNIMTTYVDWKNREKKKKWVVIQNILLDN